MILIMVTILVIFAMVGSMFLRMIVVSIGSYDLLAGNTVFDIDGFFNVVVGVLVLIASYFFVVFLSRR